MPVPMTKRIRKALSKVASALAMRSVSPCGSLPPIATSTVGREAGAREGMVLGLRPSSAHSQPICGRALEPDQSSAKAPGTGG